MSGVWLYGNRGLNVNSKLLKSFEKFLTVFYTVINTVENGVFSLSWGLCNQGPGLIEEAGDAAVPASGFEGVFSVAE